VTDAVREMIIERAREIRAARESGDYSFVCNSVEAAAFIVSYSPAEPLPLVKVGGVTKQPWSYIDDDLALLSGSDPSSLDFAAGSVAAGIKLVLGTRHGLELRRIVWHDDETEDCPE
jgi:hypothetical protein